jgi:general stress protein YciG
MKLTHEEICRRGGKKTLERHGREQYSEMGKKGAEGKVKKYGKDYYSKLSKMGVLAKKLKKENKDSLKLVLANE